MTLQNVSCGDGIMTRAERRNIRHHPRARTHTHVTVRAGGNSGFTLVELLVTVMILSIGIMGVAQVLAVAERHTAHARDETKAISLAQEIREKVMCENFDDVYSIFNGIDTDSPGSVPTVAHDWMNHIHGQLGPTGRGTVVVTTPDNDAGIAHGMRGIVVMISWNERGRTVSVPMRFAIAKTSP